ncbi:MAG TPA: hypothetical protein VN880_21430 [Solirubrobacteraceae bacterium]|nr:hypothetical protein [Solirubrobacteraceae bacterium]
MAVTLTPSHYVHGDQQTDFKWMIEQPEYKSTLFIFNDNDEQFRAFLDDQTPGTSGCRDGGNNAVIRHYRCLKPPRAAGIPTGPGYVSLSHSVGDDGTVKGVIDDALEIIKSLLASGQYDQLVYSAGASDDELGASLFPELGDDVKRYAVAELRKGVQ